MSVVSPTSAMAPVGVVWVGKASPRPMKSAPMRDPRDSVQLDDRAADLDDTLARDFDRGAALEAEVALRRDLDVGRAVHLHTAGATDLDLTLGFDVDHAARFERALGGALDHDVA